MTDADICTVIRRVYLQSHGRAIEDPSSDEGGILADMLEERGEAATARALRMPALRFHTLRILMRKHGLRTAKRPDDEHT